jgi:hypothetical protein
MTLRAISKSMFLPVMLCGLSVAPMMARAQHDGTNGPPKVLFTTREFVKPGNGVAHEKTEAASAAAMAAAKGSLYYLTLASITGEPRIVSLAGYDSMADVENRYTATMKIPGLEEKLNRIGDEDGALLTGESTAIWRLREDLSSTTNVNMADMRMAELVQIETKPGHGSDFETVVRNVIGAWAKADPSYHAAVFEMAFGHHAGPVYLLILPMKSMARLDALHDEHDAFMKALGEDASKKDGEAARSAFVSSEANLFVFSPRMSYVPESWVKEDPTFWKPKPMMMPAKTKGAKPPQ